METFVMVFNDDMIPLNYVICDLAIPLMSVGVDFSTVSIVFYQN